MNSFWTSWTYEENLLTTNEEGHGLLHGPEHGALHFKAPPCVEDEASYLVWPRSAMFYPKDLVLLLFSHFVCFFVLECVARHTAALFLFNYLLVWGDLGTFAPKNCRLWPVTLRGVKHCWNWRLFLTRVQREYATWRNDWYFWSSSLGLYNIKMCDLTQIQCLIAP